MKVALQNLEPGAVIKTPEVLRVLGYSHPVAMFVGGEVLSGYATFLAGTAASPSPKLVMWPAGADAKPAPMPEEFERVEDNAFVEARKKSMQKSWLGLPYNYTSGTDPEFFVVNGKNEVMPARSFLREKDKCPSHYYDGLQAEIAPTGNGCLQVLSKAIMNGFENVLYCARAKDSTARITIRNSFTFTPEQMKSFSDEDVRFRCSTSLNVYDDGGELPEAREYLHRFAGGHIHIGSRTKTPAVIRAMVRSLDGILGVAGVSLARNWDTRERRRMYGRAGEFRLPKHGLEYRVLSNFWLCSPLIYHLTFELARYAYRIGEGGAFDILYDGTEQEIRDCINNCDVDLAVKLIERNAGLYSHIFSSIWQGRAQKTAMDTLRNGLETVVKNPDDVMNNWRSGHGSSYPMEWGRMFA